MTIGYVAWLIPVCAAAISMVAWTGSSTAQAQATSNSWTVEITPKQARKLAKLKTEKSNTAFAISPDGSWGRAWGVKDIQGATERALHWCRYDLKPGRRDCIAYSVNGVVVAPQVVSTKVVSQVYKPIDGKRAAAFFGISPLNFQGNRAAALAQLEQMPGNPNFRTSLVRDRSLEAALTNKSFSSISRGGFVIWLGADDVEQAVAVRNGILVARYSNWVATKDGLICLFDGRWQSTGKKVNDKCMILDQISNGKVKFSWSGSPDAMRKAQIVAGDARWATVR